MNQNTALTVTVQNPDGSGRLVTTVDQFVNARRVVSDLLNEPPAGFKRVPQIVQIDLRNMAQGGDVYPVGGGKMGISGRVYAQMREKAGISVVNSRTEATTVNDKPGVRVTVWAIRPRPGMPSMHTCKSVEASYEDFYEKRKANSPQKQAEARMFLARNLETAALNRATRELLGEPTGYSQQELQDNGGRFLLVTEVPDPTDPMVRELMVRQSIGASMDLYGLPANTQTLPAPADSEPVSIDELLPGEISDSLSEGESGGGAGDPVDRPPAGRSAPSSTNDPMWARSFAFDQVTGRRFDSLTLKETEAILRAELKRIQYDFVTDPARISDLGRSANWVQLAQNLYAWQNGGVG